MNFLFAPLNRKRFKNISQNDPGNEINASQSLLVYNSLGIANAKDNNRRPSSIHHFTEAGQHINDNTTDIMNITPIIMILGRLICWNILSQKSHLPAFMAEGRSPRDSPK